MIGREVHSENYKEIIEKVRDLKAYQKRHSKERKLIVNLQRLVKDCRQNEIDNMTLMKEGISMGTLPLSTERTNNNTMKSNRTI